MLLNTKLDFFVSNFFVQIKLHRPASSWVDFEPCGSVWLATDKSTHATWYRILYTRHVCFVLLASPNRYHLQNLWDKFSIITVGLCRFDPWVTCINCPLVLRPPGQPSLFVSYSDSLASSNTDYHQTNCTTQHGRSQENYYSEFHICF